jgi:hypothetical protein
MTNEMKRLGDGAFMPASQYANAMLRINGKEVAITGVDWADEEDRTVETTRPYRPAPVLLEVDAPVLTMAKLEEITARLRAPMEVVTEAEDALVAWHALMLHMKQGSSGTWWERSEDAHAQLNKVLKAVRTDGFPYKVALVGAVDCGERIIVSASMRVVDVVTGLPNSVMSTFTFERVLDDGSCGLASFIWRTFDLVTELVQHELAECFTFANKRLFDPHDPATSNGRRPNFLRPSDFEGKKR